MRFCGAAKELAKAAVLTFAVDTAHGHSTLMAVITSQWIGFKNKM